MLCLVTTSLHATKRVFKEVTKIHLLQIFTVPHHESWLLSRHENTFEDIATNHKIKNLLNVGLDIKAGQIILAIF